MKCALYFFCFLVSAGASFGQPKQKPVVKKSVTELERILNGTRLPFRIVNDSLAVVPYSGANLASFDVVIQKISDLYIVYTNLTEILPGKIDESKYKYLLRQNDHFDIIKIGMSEADNTVYLRADLYKAGTSTVLLKRVLAQVANVTNIIGGDLK